MKEIERMIDGNTALTIIEQEHGRRVVVEVGMLAMLALGVLPF